MAMGALISPQSYGGGPPFEDKDKAVKRRRTIILLMLTQ